MVDTEYGKVPTVLSAYVLPTIRAAAGPWPSSESRHLCPALWSLRLTDSVCGTAPCAVGRRQGGTVAPRTPTSEKPEIEGREVRTQRPARRVSQPQRQRQPSQASKSAQGQGQRTGNTRRPRSETTCLIARAGAAAGPSCRPITNGHDRHLAPAHGLGHAHAHDARPLSALSSRLPSRPRAHPASPSLAECQSSHSCLVL